MNGAWYVLKYGVQLMVDSGNGGRVVNISSLAAISGVSATTGTSHYGLGALNLNFWLRTELL